MTRVGFHTVDLAGSVATEPQGPQTKPIRPTHTITPPPQNDPRVREIMALLLAGGTIATLAVGLSVLLPDVSMPNLRAVVGLALSESALPALSSGAGDAETVARAQELAMRAAYIQAAAERLEKAEQAGKPTRTALADESLLYRRHRNAQFGRTSAARKVDQAARDFGDTLGWYLNPLLNNEIECIKANGHNFKASEGTVIGWPGAVHPHCGCVAGPPIPGAGWVNDSVKPVLLDTSGRRIYRPHKTA